MYETGQILLVHSYSTLAKLIQKFQMQNDAKAGYYNHSGTIWVDDSGVYVLEMAEIEGYKHRAATVFTPIQEYLNSERELLLLKPKGHIALPANTESLYDFKRICYKYIGVPYDYGNLFVHQVVRLLRGKWIGRKQAKAAKRMVCHELTMKLWHEHKGIFSKWEQASVADIYNNTNFTHHKIQ